MSKKTSMEFVICVYPSAVAKRIMGNFWTVMDDDKELGRGPNPSVAWNHAAKTLKTEGWFNV